MKSAVTLLWQTHTRLFPVCGSRMPNVVNVRVLPAGLDELDLSDYVDIRPR
jgi:hypothetical protein